MQKQSILSLLGSYLSGSENVKKVINSPCLDFHSGKVLSYDGSKVFNSNSRYNRGNRRGGFNNRQKNSNSEGRVGKNQHGKNGKPNSKKKNNQQVN